MSIAEYFEHILKTFQTYFVDCDFFGKSLLSTGNLLKEDEKTGPNGVKYFSILATSRLFGRHLSSPSAQNNTFLEIDFFEKHFLLKK